MSDPDHSAPHGRKEGPDRDEVTRAEQAELSARLEQLGTALGKARKKPEETGKAGGRDTSSASGAALAFRLGAEFVSGVLVGSAIGYGIDYVFSISPWGLIVFTLAGFAAGVFNMMRAAGQKPFGS